MITVEVNSIDLTNLIEWESFSVQQVINENVDTCNFRIRNYGNRNITVLYSQEVAVYDGATKIFGGRVQRITEEVESGGGGVVLNIEASDYAVDLDRLLVGKTYDNYTVKQIIDDLITSYAPSFNTDNVSCNTVLNKMVFNQVPISVCLKRLAQLVNFNWYIDPDKNIYFFDISQASAPFSLTDTNGSYVYNSLERNIDGTQLVNRVKVRGGEYEGDIYTDKITVSGSNTKTFNLPYKFANLTVSVNAVSKTVGIDGIDTFATRDVLFNYQEKIIKFQNNLTDGDLIEYSGNPKVRVFAIAEDTYSVGVYGAKETLIRDESIRSNIVARKRATAELFAYASEMIDASFSTYEKGLRAGMRINIQSDKRGIDDYLLIKSVSFTPIDPENFEYKVELVSQKTQDLVDVLRNILEPKPSDEDDAEVSEEIFMDNQAISITEDNYFITPVEDYATISIAENIIVLTGVEFVLAPYSPTSQTDPKREGALDVSMYLY